MQSVLFVFSGGGAKVQERRFLGKLLEQTTLSVSMDRPPFAEGKKC